MIENLILTSSPSLIQKKYKIASIEFAKREPCISLISGGDIAPVSSSFSFLENMKFGFNCQSAIEQPGILNLQTELIEPKEDEQEYDRLWRACETLDFAESMNRFRCVIFIDAFLVTGFENCNYLIHMNNPEDKPFAIAGIYTHYTHPFECTSSTGFAIITVPPNNMLKRVGVESMPVILKPTNIEKWINKKTDRREYYPLIHTYPDDTMNGYQVSGKIFNYPLNKEYLQPIGERLKPKF